MDSEDDEVMANIRYRAKIYTSVNHSAKVNQKKTEIGKQFMLKFSDFKRVRSIGHGNFAEAYKVSFWDDSKKHYVLKVPITKEASLNEFKNEMMGLMNAQGQENILKFIGIVSSPDGRDCFVTEFCKVGSLDKLHHKVDLTQPEKFWKIAMGIAAGLQHLHHNHYIHRDIACRNILMTENMEVRISVFGLIVHAPTGAYESKFEEELPWPWMSPETLASRNRIFKSNSDMWSLGVTMWEVLTMGEKPYGFDQSFILGIIEGKVTLDVPKKWEGTSMQRYVCAIFKKDIVDYSHPLMWALRNDDFETAKFLIEERANLEVGDHDNITTLMWASRRCRTNTAKFLIENGANLEARDDNGQTPLLWASNSTHWDEGIDTAKLLIEKRANLEAKDRDGGMTPLLRAVSNGLRNNAKLFIEKGANLEAKDHNGYTALLWAIETETTDVAKLLIEKGANIEAEDDRGITPLILVSNTDATDVAKLLIEKGANIEAKDDCGQTPLMHTIIAFKPYIAELLIEKGADLEAKDDQSMTALIHACKDIGDPNTARMLIEKKANLEVKDNYGKTPLMWASEGTHGETWTLELLVENGVSLKTKDNKGCTCLHWACSDGETDIAELLIKKGANIFSKNDSGKTPLELAEERGRNHMVKLLKKHIALATKRNNNNTDCMND